MTLLKVITPVTDMRETPMLEGVRGKLESQLVFGEELSVEKVEGEWSYGASLHDGYKGWVKSACLGTLPAPTHIITAARSDTYNAPTMKSLRFDTLSFGSRITVLETGEKFSKLESGVWVYNAHLKPITSIETDTTVTAKKFLETPYYWGGRSGFGIDCSGLAQVCLARAGIKALRDCDLQEKTVGTEITHARTGDLVYFKGHVGIMIDAENILHANAHHMKVTIEPLWVVKERSGDITAIRRI